MAWFGDLTPGSRVLLTYNSNEGPLKNATTIRVHLGTDNWYKEQIDVRDLPNCVIELRCRIQIRELKKLSAEEIQKNRVAEECGPGNWWGIPIDIPVEIAVMNYVFDDGKSAEWDNNNGRDYTTPISNPLTHDQLVEKKKDDVRNELTEERTQRVEGAATAARDRILSRVRPSIDMVHG